MEIADYLTVARRRVWILVLVPVLAAAAALAYGLLSPKTYSATATVRTPSLVGTQYSQFSGPQAIAQFVSAFAASAADPTVVAQTARETGVSAAELTGDVTVAQVGASSNVTLTYSGEDRTASATVAHTLATNALTNIYAAQGKIADMQAEAAKAGLATANKAVNAYVVKAGVGEPTAAYQAAVTQVAWLEQTQANYRALGEDGSANVMNSAITSARKRASAIGSMLPEYNILLSAQSVANQTYQAVLGDQRKVQVQATAAADPGVVQTGETTPDVTPATIAKLVVPVFGAALLLTIILIALVEFVVAARRQPALDDDQQGAAVGAEGPADRPSDPGPPAEHGRAAKPRRTSRRAPSMVDA